MPTIDVQQLHEDALRIGRENPTRRVAQCTYFTEGGAPNCIVGHALAKQGVTLEHVKRMRLELSTCGPNGARIESLVKSNPELFGGADPNGALVIDLQRMQTAQDSPNGTWGDSVASSQLVAA